MLNTKYYSVYFYINTGKFLWISAIPPNSRKICFVGWLFFYSAYQLSPEKNINMREQLTYYITQMQFDY